MPTRVIDGLAVNWMERAGQGPTVLLLHCSLAMHRAWSGVIEGLPDDAHVIAMDLPGHGATDFDPSRGIVAQTRAVAEILAQDTGGPVHLVGHSFGAVVALHIAARSPALVASLTLYEPVLFALTRDVGNPVWDEQVAFDQGFVRAMDQGAEAGLRHFLSRWGEGEDIDALSETRRRYLLDRIGLITVSKEALFGDGPERLYADELTSIVAPVRLMAGSASPQIVHNILDVIAPRVDCRNRITINGAAHMGPITHPAEVAAEISAQL